MLFGLSMKDGTPRDLTTAATTTSFRLIGTILDLNAERKLLVQKAALLEGPISKSREFLIRSIGTYSLTFSDEFEAAI